MESPRHSAGNLLQARYMKISPLIILGLLVGAGFIIWQDLNPAPHITVIYNQIGYWPRSPKVFFTEVPAGMDNANGEFTIAQQSDDSKVFSGTMQYLGILWERYYFSGNFTAFSTTGEYKLTVKIGDLDSQTVTIVISPAAYDLTMLRAVQFYYYQRCGIEVPELVPGYVGHLLCHADDGIYETVNNQQVWRDLSGGWHDAGDYGKYTEDAYNTQFSVYGLSYNYRMNRAFWNTRVPNTYETAAPDVLDEAIWGARFLQKMTTIDATGKARYYCGIYARTPEGEWDRFGYWGIPSDETDNVPQTGDERTVGSLYNVSGMEEYKNHDYGWLYTNADAAMVAAAGLANTAMAARDFNYWDAEPWAPARLTENASALFWSHIDKYFNSTWDLREGFGFYNLWKPAICAISLYDWAIATGNASGAANYLSLCSKMHPAILADFPKNTDPNWWDPHMGMLALWQLDAIVNTTVSLDFYSVAHDWAKKSILDKCNETGNFFNFVKRETSYFGYWGTSWSISTASMAGVIAWNVTQSYMNETGGWASHEEDWMRDYAIMNNIDWIMGRNPLGVCQVESLGELNLPVYHHRYASIPGNPRGALPGCVPNGIAKAPLTAEEIAQYENEYEAYDAAPDLPWFDMDPPNPEKIELADFRSNEAYISDNAGFLFGLATMFYFLGS